MSSLLKKIFSIRNDIDSLHKVITILGFKIKLKNVFNYRYKKERFFIKHEKYINKQNKKKIKRLFITTGNYNLLNVLTLIKQLDSGDYEDSLVIISHSKNEEFIRCNSLMAGIHNFKKVFFLDGPDYAAKGKAFVEKVSFSFDEVYAASMGSAPSFAIEYYPHAKKYLVDEGILGLIARPYINYDSFDLIYLNKYNDKIDEFGFSKENSNKIKYINFEIFLEVSKQIAYKVPIMKFDNRKKNVLLCGTCCESAYLTEDQYSEVLDNLIDLLINKGYHVIFKQHPRDSRNYLKKNKIDVLRNNLPLEVYELENVLAVVSFSSMVATHLFYFRQIPGFQVSLSDNKDATYTNLAKIDKKFLEEYTPEISSLLDINAKEKNISEIKMELNKIYKTFFINKEKLSENNNFINYVKQLDYEFPED